MPVNEARLKTFLNVPQNLRQWTNYLQQALENFASTLTSSDLVDVSAAGSALMTAADVNAQKTILGISTATLDSGIYTPTLTNVTNIAASTAYQCQYLRVGTTVSVSGKVDVDPTAAAASELGISLPIAADLASLQECAGAAFASGIAGQGAAIVGDSGNDRASMRWVAVDVTNQPMYFTFSYRAASGGGGGAAGTTNTYTTGSGTETVPGGKSSVVITTRGGGGAGAGYISGGYFSFRGGGGGGGGYSQKTIAVTPGDTLAYSVGGQVFGVSTGDGPAGNASTVSGTVSGGSVGMTANGGAGGKQAGTGGAGGTASGGDTNTSGSAGTASGGPGGAGGGSGGGAGGTAGGGNGSIPGGGGGGSYGGTSGNGARGQVSFTYT